MQSRRVLTVCCTKLHHERCAAASLDPQPVCHTFTHSRRLLSQLATDRAFLYYRTKETGCLAAQLMVEVPFPLRSPAGANAPQIHVAKKYRREARPLPHGRRRGPNRTHNHRIHSIYRPNLLARTSEAGGHALRHACGARFRADGLKELPVHLGHCSTSATSTDAKVNMLSQSEVAAFRFALCARSPPVRGNSHLDTIAFARRLRLACILAFGAVRGRNEEGV